MYPITTIFVATALLSALSAAVPYNVQDSRAD